MKNKLYILFTGIGLCFLGACINMQNKNNSYGKVIIVNGPSAVGKSSIIKAFQTKQKDLWLSIGIDNFFVGVLPAKYYLEDKPENWDVMHGIKSEDKNGNKLFTLKVGPQGNKVIRGMHRAIADYAKCGNNVIVDYIQYDPKWLPDLKKTLKGLNVVIVGVTASLENLEKREQKRATSPQGHARSHYDTVHKNIKYDLMLNTDNLSSEEAADKIIEFVNK